MAIRHRIQKLEIDRQQGICTCPTEQMTADMTTEKVYRIYRQKIKCTAHQMESDKAFTAVSKLSEEEISRWYYKFIHGE